MSEKAPRVSIGVPVYNGEKYIVHTLDSLLGQTFSDFELIICDNASTDSTEEICRSYAQRDARVRYFRNPENIGPGPNYNRCVELARGELFKWNAADDVCAPTFLERCIEKLDASPDVVLVYPRTKSIGPDGEVVSDYESELELSTPSVAKRLQRFVNANHRQHTAHELWGVMRLGALRDTNLQGSFPSADRVLVADLLLRGRFERVEEYLFFNREHPHRSTHSVGRQERRVGSKLSCYIGGGPTPAYEWWNPLMRGKIVFPEWKWLAEYVRATLKMPMTVKERISCLAVLALLYVKFAPRLARDLVIASELAFYRVAKLASIMTLISLLSVLDTDFVFT